MSTPTPSIRSPRHRRARPRWTFLALLVTFALVALACGDDDGGGEATATTAATATTVAGQEPAVDLSDVTLHVGIFQEVTSAQVELTDYFDDTPYKIEWAILNGAAPTMQALGGGAIDISWGLSDTAAPKASAEDREVWTAENAPLKWVALLGPVDAEAYPSGIIVAHKDSGINTLADLRGKTYAYNEGGNAEARALLALHEAGLTKDDVEVRLLKSDALASAVASHAVDAAAPTYGTVAGELADGTLKLIATQEEVGFPGYTSITARTDALNDPRLEAAIGDFITRATRFSEWRASHLDEAAVSYVDTQQLTQEQALEAVRSSSTRILPIGPGDPGVKTEEDLAVLLHEIGFLRTEIDVHTLIDDRYSDAIAAGLAG